MIFFARLTRSAERANSDLISGFFGRMRESDPDNTSRGTTHAYWQAMRSHPTPALPIHLRERDVCNVVIRDQVSQDAAHDGHYGRSTPPSPHVVSDRLRLSSLYNVTLTSSVLCSTHIIPTNKHIATSSKPKTTSPPSTVDSS